MHPRTFIRLLVLVTSSVFALPSVAGQPAPVPQRLRAGVGSVDITPDRSNPDWHGDSSRPIYLAGFGENRTATGIHDHIYARAVVLETPSASITNLPGCRLALGDSALKLAIPHSTSPFRLALVSVDLIGYYWHQGDYGAEFALEKIAAGSRSDLLLLSSTHDHEAPDTIGLWGPQTGVDGKNPEYLHFVDAQIARAVQAAMSSLTPVEMRAGVIDAREFPDLRRLQQRTRPPNFTDDQLRVIQLLRKDQHPLATLVNWNTHPESMESHNHLLTSDFVGSLRETVEKRTGAICIYFTGDIGAVEAPGDEDLAGTGDEVIHGQHFARDPQTHAAIPSFERTQAIGASVADAALAGLDRGQPVHGTALRIRSIPICSRVTNTGYLGLMQAGVLKPRLVSGAPPTLDTMLYDIRYGDVEFLTLPGELFPELYYGVARHHRTDCPAASTGRPYEPAIRDFVRARVPFILGLSPDELGYILPSYDFRPYPPEVMIAGKRAVDACPQTPAHYHETNSVGYEMAPAVTCAYVSLLGGNPVRYAACRPTAQTLTTTSR